MAVMAVMAVMIGAEGTGELFITADPRPEGTVSVLLRGASLLRW